MADLKQIIKMARGGEPVDLVLKGGRLINVFSGEIYEEEIAIYDDLIVGIGSGYAGKKEIDLKGSFVAPGFIDGHVHIESSMVEIPQFARSVVPLGTTSVVADPHEVANVFGYDGIRYMLESSKYNPLNVFFMLPSCVPSTSLETAGSSLRAFDIFPLLREKWVLGLAEMMNFPGVLAGDEDTLDKLKISADKRLDGHAPMLTGKDLCAYVAAGVSSDHECTTREEAQEKLRMGMYVMIREGTGTKNMRDLLPLVTKENSRRCFFVTDDRHPNDILSEGHINYMVKTAVELGLDVVTAVQMATINTADYFGLRKIGALSPGRFADIVVFDDLKTLAMKMVFKNGRLVAENGKPTYELPARPQQRVRGSVNIKWLEGNEFEIPAKGSKCRVIGLVKDQILTDEIIAEPRVENGRVVSDTSRDILKLVVVERHNASGNIGKGLVKGFGLKSGAIGSSVSHDSHNIVVVGVTDDDIFRVVTRINKIGGGIVVSDGGEVIGTLELPIAGLMSNLPLDEVAAKMEELIQKARSLGATPKDPIMALSFLALPVIPKLKLTDKGLVDVEKFDFVDLFV